MPRWRQSFDTLSDFVRRNAGDSDVTWPYPVDWRHSMSENIAAIGTRLAHEEIATRRVGPLQQMGSTLALVLVHGQRAATCHVGDSRVYRLRETELEQLTVDHSMYEQLRASGLPDLPPRAEFPHRNMITRALGLTGGPETRSIELRPGDTFLLCTDGLSEEIPASRLAQLLSERDIEAACSAMVLEAYERGGRDNITAVVVRCLAEIRDTRAAHAF